MDLDDLYTLHSSIISYPRDSNFLGDISDHHHHHQNQQEQVASAAEIRREMPDVIKAQIANHPLYPDLLSAYIECKKVGAPSDMITLLEEISKENHPISTTSTNIGTDPELDDFMKSYCEVLIKYKEELSKPFDEATNFLSSIESQLTDLCKETLPLPTLSYHSTDDETGGPSDDVTCQREVVEAPPSQEAMDNPQALKEMLMHKYSGYLSSLRKEFLKKRKKGKLPKDARITLLEWWNTHYRWPYPTEEEKNRLSEITGLDPKQISNWFINQRKRHWRPSEDMRFALMEGVSGGGSSTSTSTINANYFDATGGKLPLPGAETL